jgi:hypothetical protein
LAKRWKGRREDLGTSSKVPRGIWGESMQMLCQKITRVLKYGCVWKWCKPRANGSFNCENQWLTSWFVQWLEVTLAIVHWLCYISKDNTEKDTEIHPQRHVVYSLLDEARAVKTCPTLLLMGMTALT